MYRITFTALIMLMISGCSVQRGPKKNTFPDFETQGHRGARGLMPENTIPAMLHAIDLGVTTLEMDCHISADSLVVVSHDDAINPAHSLKPDGSELEPKKVKPYILFQMPYSQIKQFDIGTKYFEAFPRQKKMVAHIPLLSALIDSVEAYTAQKGKAKMFYNIETKSKASGDGKYHPDPQTFVRLLMEVIEEKGITSRVMIQSFDMRTLQVLHEKYPEVHTSLLVSRGTLEDHLNSLGFIPDIYSPNYKLVDQQLVEQSHEKGMRIIPWTVNTKADIERIKALGVDGIISDYPDLFFN